MQSWLQNNAKELTRVGVDPNNVAQMYQQNPSGFGEFVDHLGMSALGPNDYFNVQDKMAGREIDRGRLAETIRSNQAGEALTARGQPDTWTEHQRTECCSFPRNTKSRITRKGSGQTDSQRKQSVKA
jgi:hypothetical protein